MIYALVGSIAGFFLFVMVLLTGGWFLYVLLVAAIVAAFIMFHWMMWGKYLTEQTAGEKEELAMREQVDDFRDSHE
jgi:hypothetical protein